jgi:hypothetical protein
VCPIIYLMKQSVSQFADCKSRSVAMYQVPWWCRFSNLSRCRRTCVLYSAQSENKIAPRALSHFSPFCADGQLPKVGVIQ